MRCSRILSIIIILIIIHNNKQPPPPGSPSRPHSRRHLHIDARPPIPTSSSFMLPLPHSQLSPRRPPPPPSPINESIQIELVIQDYLIAIRSTSSLFSIIATTTLYLDGNDTKISDSLQYNPSALNSLYSAETDLPKIREYFGRSVQENAGK